MTLRVENTTSVRLRFTCTSNLHQQIFILADAALTVPAEGVQLLPQQSLAVHVCLLPIVSEEALDRGECRTIEGGVQLRVWRDQNLGTPSSITFGTQF